jgi:hypothetical protein
MDNRRNKPRVRPSTTSSAHHFQQVVHYCKYGIDESTTESSHVHMKLVTQVSEYRPIAMYSCRMTGTKLVLSGYSPQRLISLRPQLRTRYNARCFPRPKMTAFLWLALGWGIPRCNSERAYEVFSPCSLRHRVPAHCVEVRNQRRGTQRSKQLDEGSLVSEYVQALPPSPPQLNCIYFIAQLKEIQRCTAAPGMHAVNPHPLFQLPCGTGNVLHVVTE